MMTRPAPLASSWGSHKSFTAELVSDQPVSPSGANQAALRPAFSYLCRKPTFAGSAEQLKVSVLLESVVIAVVELGAGKVLSGTIVRNNVKYQQEHKRQTINSTFPAESCAQFL